MYLQATATDINPHAFSKDFVTICHEHLAMLLGKHDFEALTSSNLGSDEGFEFKVLMERASIKMKLDNRELWMSVTQDYVSKKLSGLQKSHLRFMGPSKAPKMLMRFLPDISPAIFLTETKYSKEGFSAWIHAPSHYGDWALNFGEAMVYSVFNLTGVRYLQTVTIGKTYYEHRATAFVRCRVEVQYRR
jgi:hypothetical protein